jgi:hypothetical protein
MQNCSQREFLVKPHHVEYLIKVFYCLLFKILQQYAGTKIVRLNSYWLKEELDFLDLFGDGVVYF